MTITDQLAEARQRIAAVEKRCMAVEDAMADRRMVELLRREWEEREGEPECESSDAASQ